MYSKLHVLYTALSKENLATWPSNSMAGGKIFIVIDVQNNEISYHENLIYDMLLKTFSLQTRKQ
jgi:hypothetical protein